MNDTEKIDLKAIGLKGEWRLALEEDQLQIDSGEASFVFIRDDFHSRVYVRRFGGESFIFAPTPKVTAFGLPDHQCLEVEKVLGSPTKSQLKIALRHFSSKWMIGCGIFLILISLPALGMEFDMISALLGIAFLVIAVASRFIIRPGMMFIAVMLPLSVGLSSAYNLWQTSFSSVLDWIILVFMLILMKAGWEQFQRFRMVKDNSVI